MHSQLTRVVMALLVHAVLLTSGAMGQLLSIRKVDTQYSIEASVPAATPHTLQTTENFRLWIDVTNHVTDPFSSLLEYSRVSSRYFRLVPSAREPPPIRIAVLGDSLISDDMGWGGGIRGYLKPNATFINYAYPGYFSLAPILWHFETLSLVRPQYVIFEFGATDVANGVTKAEFEANLKTIVDRIRGWGGVPLLVTVHCHRRFDANGNFIPEDFEYNYITRKVAAEKNADLIDLDKIVGDLYRRLGPTGSEFMRFIDPRFPNDTIHLSPMGAAWISQLVLKTLPGSIGPYLTEKVFDPPPNP